MSAGLDPYRDWLRSRLSEELGVREAQLVIQAAVQRRGWPAVRTLGPRDVVAVLQDVYEKMRERVGDGRADKWLEVTTVDLARFAATVPVPAEGSAGEGLPTPPPVRWGRRAHDLPLLLARAHAEIAARSLSAIRASPVMASLERAAEWDVQATLAEVRRWETEDRLTRLRSDHARLEVADQVAAAVAQGQVLRLTVRELESAARGGQAVDGQLAHNRLMSTQTDAFLETFTPLIDLTDADRPFPDVETDLDSARFSLGVPLHPNVLRARHALNYAQWQAGDAGDASPGVLHAQHDLHLAEHDARDQLEGTLDSARRHQAQFRTLAVKATGLDQRASRLASSGGDPLSVARIRLEWRQTRSAARIQAHRCLEALCMLDGLISEA
ncbi:hypothetical protein HNQ07_000858 [Deinococcus metalli]|uniref:TolC family protein n=1 Tax=Deinococcus metalli TaxID=1141878 RepID=A0A7W8KC11_9DEIO|nr:hypothetical protein [Deinococcus metalli]MBB5375414.1 hypothetical protein [Deinococcus metalli]GHF29460.1 hypothetical protein GCM10017781_01810 [Deinococcus metalli]